MIESRWRRPVRATIGLERLCEGPEGRDDEARLVAATPVSEHPRERGERLQITFRSIGLQVCGEHLYCRRYVL
jgi:hypothetical protein